MTCELLIAILFSSHHSVGKLSLLITQWLGALGLGVSLILVMYENPLLFNLIQTNRLAIAGSALPGLPKDTFGP
ncbi:MAG: hypothetical protein IPP55_18330 [Anaerolineales bacterium]|nr:hypothetical protein [Anaerolineales bacterium]